MLIPSRPVLIIAQRTDFIYPKGYTFKEQGMTESLTYRNFAVGIENFEELRTKKLAYIDKTS